MTIAFITGGTSGIGLATVERFLAEGIRVAVLGRPGARLDAVRARLASSAVGIAIAGDVRRSTDLAEAIVTTRDQLGPIDILVTAAGVSNAPHISELTDAQYDDLMDTNVRGTVLAVRHALPHLATGASIVVVGSVGGSKGQPGDALYAGSKGFVRAFARSAGTDPQLLARGIRVNCVSPGPIDTPLTHEATSQPAVRSYVEQQLVPMRRWGRAEEVANAIYFLASTQSSFTTGAELTVDGGMAHA